jgi:hypothetical protein
MHGATTTTTTTTTTTKIKHKLKFRQNGDTDRQSLSHVMRTCNLYMRHILDMFTSFQNLSQNKVPEFFVKWHYIGI